MRTCIKGDGSDGTAALKAYLLAHDDVLAQEFYEFVSPGVGAPLGIGPGSATTWPSVTAEPFRSNPDYEWGTLYVNAVAGIATGIITRTYSITLGEYTQPGYIIFSFGGLRPAGSVSAATITANAYYSPSVPGGYGAFFTLTLSIDGGLTYPYTFISSGTLTTTPTDYTIDLATLVPSVIPDLTSFDYTKLKVKMQTNSSIFWSGFQDPGLQMFVTVSADVTSGGGGGSGVSIAPTLIGRFTDSNSPLTYRGNVYTPTNIKNDGFKSKIGLDVDSLKLSWKFRGDEIMVTDPGTGAPVLTFLEGFKEGLWSGVWVRWLRVFMPTFGDCDSLGAVRMFRGRIAEVTADRLAAELTVNSVTEMFNRQIPQQLIEANNRSMQVGPGLPPDLDPDPARWTIFECVAGHGGTVQKIVAQQTAPTAGIVYAPGTYDLGYIVFSAAPLRRVVAQVQRYDVVGGYNVFYLFRPLYFDPHPSGMSFTGFIPGPKDQTISGVGGVELSGFPFVPLPEQAV